MSRFIVIVRTSMLTRLPVLCDRARALNETVINSFIVGQTQPELLREIFEALQSKVFLDANSGPYSIFVLL